MPSFNQLRVFLGGFRPWILASVSLSVGFGALSLNHPSPGRPSHSISKKDLAEALGRSTGARAFPTQIVIGADRKPSSALDPAAAPRALIPQYSFDAELQETMESLFKSYDPDHGAFAALDAETGRVLALVSYSRDPQIRAGENLALRASFPSASIFKVVTASAAIAEKRFSPETRIPYSGGNHTLYRKNVMQSGNGRWSRQITLRDAFARSINTVFGKIGAFSLGAEKLRTYAYRFGFNQTIASDVPIETGRALISEDQFEIAESASGYTQQNTMSPLQGALIAAAVVNDGKMMQPFFVKSLHTADGTPVYEAKPELFSQAIDSQTAREVRELMRETVVHGTSRKGFRGFFRSGFQGVDVGGKTGSLTGLNPPGKYDWFIGYGEFGGRKIALSALTVNGKLWKVKSSYLARRAIETHFRSLNAHHKSSRRSTVAAR